MDSCCFRSFVAMALLISAGLSYCRTMRNLTLPNRGRIAKKTALYRQLLPIMASVEVLCNQQRYSASGNRCALNIAPTAVSAKTTSNMALPSHCANAPIIPPTTSISTPVSVLESAT